ncbi:hypothetical protein [Rhodococcus opacus]|uniref:hypothetical protein n=1 Tax=Rhodococcus opacus TaxID=37919 RepID=UPI001F55DE90|nr:hypothetical protein [Rhodococcus opacus]UNN00745.1 hypothetical protein MOO23_34885 [Rhodococcus opacus]
MSDRPDYLVTTNRLAEQVDPADLAGSLTAIVDAIAELERLIRIPEDFPFIDFGDPAGVPITAAVAQIMENSGHTGADHGAYGLAAVIRLGALFGGFKALEQVVNDTRKRVDGLA